MLFAFLLRFFLSKSDNTDGLVKDIYYIFELIHVNDLIVHVIPMKIVVC